MQQQQQPQQQQEGNSAKPTANKNNTPREDPGGIEPETFWVPGCCGGRGACACGLWLVCGGGVFLGEVKARRKDIISSSLDYQKQKLSTDKQVIFKPQFTRHAGKAGGFFRWVGEKPPTRRIKRFETWKVWAHYKGGPRVDRYKYSL